MRYCAGVSVAMPAGTAAAQAGTLGMLHAPVASTTVGLRQSPRSVVTRYPPSALRTEVTVVSVSTGAAITRA